MSTTVDTPALESPGPVDLDDRSPEGRLASGAIGLRGVLFLIVTGAAPITAMLFNVPVSVQGGGSAAPAAFLMATFALTIFSVGYVAMARRVTASGGFYSFISHGIGQTAATGAGVLMWLCYVAFSASVIGVCGYFTHTTLTDWLGVDIPAWAVEIVALGVMSALSWFRIELTSRVLGVFLTCELIALIVFAVAVLISGGNNGFSAAPLNPAGVFNNPDAIRVFGGAAAGVALFGAFWSWVGFEMAPNYAEESRSPKRLMGPATYISVLGLGVLYTVIAYAFVIGWGTHGAAGAVSAQFAGKYESAFYPLTSRYFGASLTEAFKLLIVTSSFACATAFYNTSARYAFSMGRERILPRALSRTHPRHQSPHVAAAVITGLVGAWVLAFTVSDPSDSAALLKLGTWSPLMGVLGILFVQALTSAAIVRYFLTTGRDGFHWFRTLLAPVVGGVAMLVACYLLIANRTALSGAGGALFIKAIPWAVLVTFLIGCAIGLYYRVVDRARFGSIGRYVFDEGPA
jgi:amino acid transporter